MVTEGAADVAVQALAEEVAKAVSSMITIPRMAFASSTLRQAQSAMLPTLSEGTRLQLSCARRICNF
jgi:hypothetical protein